MELNTPNKNQITSTSSAAVSTTASSAAAVVSTQLENSPVFNFINNLSPIVPVKSTCIHQTLNSISLTSPSAVFASPQLNQHKVAGSFLGRHQLLDLKECKLSSKAEEGTVNSELATELPKSLDRDCGTPDGSKLCPDGITTNTARRDSDPETLEKSKRMYYLFESEKSLHKIHGVEQEDEVTDWGALISDVPGVLDSPITEELCEVAKMTDPGVNSFISDVLQTPQNNVQHSETKGFAGAIDSPIDRNMGELGSQFIEFEEQTETDQTLALVSGNLLNEIVDTDKSARVDIKEKECSQVSRKQQYKILRRCLDYEMVGVKKKKSECNQTSSSPVQTEHQATDAENSKAETHNKLSKFSGRGIGLYLNAFARTSSNVEAVKIDNLSTDEQVIDMETCSNKDEVIQTASQELTDVDEEFGSASPKAKREKTKHLGASCKRCNCKRSKCLKLYCECFAAGLYCIEPCSCQGCYNKPAHEDIVIETRKQIESRDPLAFAPKVVISADAVSELGDKTNKTPASGRHKRGCHCRKSGCLKKYCECFQEGVGCSSFCRCEGCRNTFGCKTGVEENEVEVEESKVHGKTALDVTVYGDQIEKKEEHPNLPTPAKTARFPIQARITSTMQFSGSPRPADVSHQITTSRKLEATPIFDRQLRYEKVHLVAIPENEICDTSINKCPSSSAVKSTSPNSKRISPPHLALGRTSRKFVLRSVPRFPSLNTASDQ